MSYVHMDNILLILNSILISITIFFIKVWVNRIEKNIDNLNNKCQNIETELAYLKGKCEDTHGRSL